MVVSIPHESGGHEPCVVVEGHADGEISSWLVEEFGASYAIRHVFDIPELGLDEMPRSGTGKMNRLELQNAVMKMLDRLVF